MQKNSRRDFVKKIGLLGVAVAASGSIPAMNARQEQTGSYTIKDRTTPVSGLWDVIVIGGGPSGCAAAIAAAREGAKTLIIESTGTLGGMGTSGLLNVWCPFTDKKKIIYKGIAEKIFLESKKGVPHVKPTENNWVPINTEYLKRVYDDMVIQSGASVLFLSHVAAVEMKDKENIDALIVANKSGLTAYKSKVYIDCTGDGDVAAWAGAKYSVGSDNNGDTQAATLCFSLANVNQEEYMKNRFKIEGSSKESPIRAIFESKKYPLVIDTHFNVKMAAPSILSFNAGHIPNINSSDPVQVSDAMIRGRQLVNQLHSGLKEFSPAIFNKSYLSATGSLLGVREGRRIEGDYIFTIDDWLNRRSFDDEIGRNSYYIDVHKKEAKHYPRYGAGESHGIPYRCLTPKGLKNVLTAGRCISSDMTTYGSLRVMPVCLVTGEASGLAAALAAKSRQPDVHAVDVTHLRKRLKEEGQNI